MRTELMHEMQLVVWRNRVSDSSELLSLSLALQRTVLPPLYRTAEAFNPESYDCNELNRPLDTPNEFGFEQLTFTVTERSIFIRASMIIQTMETVFS